MKVRFDNTNRSLAVLVASGVRGFVVIWGFAPFWVGSSRAALENLEPPPAGGFNLENRDGMYITTAVTPTGSVLPTILPWNGDVYVLNGNGAGDQVNNLVNIMVVNQC